MNESTPRNPAVTGQRKIHVWTSKNGKPLITKIAREYPLLSRRERRAKLREMAKH